MHISVCQIERHLEEEEVEEHRTGPGKDSSTPRSAGSRSRSQLMLMLR